MTSIPIVDLAPFRCGDEADKRRCAEAVDAACREIGFLVVRGHGVPRAVQDALFDAGAAFFERPLEDKLRVRRPRNDQNRGYIPYGEETLARMHGGDTPPDFKEVFAVGPDRVPDDPYHRGPHAYPSFAPNLWPDLPCALRPSMLAYFESLEGLMRLLGRVFALGLGLAENWFEDKLDKHTSQLRLLHYPAPTTSLAPGQLRCGEHTDLGMMTILRNDAAPGSLEVRLRSGQWVTAPALQDSFVVNLGDLMMRWTNDRWISTPHRVAVPPAAARERSRRLSIGFFAGPNHDVMVECIPTCQAPHTPAKYAPVSVHDYRTNRFAAGAGLKSGAIGGASDRVAGEAV